MTRPMNLQDMFLNQARKEHIPVTIYLTNGFQFRGQVKGFDSYVVVLECDGKQNLVYKHAISTITPFKPIFIPEGEKPNSEQASSAPSAAPDTSAEQEEEQ